MGYLVATTAKSMIYDSTATSDTKARRISFCHEQVWVAPSAAFGLVLALLVGGGYSLESVAWLEVVLIGGASGILSACHQMMVVTIKLAPGSFIDKMTMIQLPVLALGVILFALL